MENKYEIHGKRLEELGILKPIYKSKYVTICNVSDYCYYIIYNESGIAINIKPEGIRHNIEEDPMILYALFSKLPYEQQRQSSFILGEQRLEKVLMDVKNKVRLNPSLSQIDPELEKQIMQEFGSPSRKL